MIRHKLIRRREQDPDRTHAGFAGYQLTEIKSEFI